MKQQLDVSSNVEAAIADAILLSVAEEQLDLTTKAKEFWFDKYKEMFELVRQYYMNCECEHTCPRCKQYHYESTSYEANQKSS